MDGGGGSSGFVETGQWMSTIYYRTSTYGVRTYSHELGIGLARQGIFLTNHNKYRELDITPFMTGKDPGLPEMIIPFKDDWGKARNFGSSNAVAR